MWGFSALVYKLEDQKLFAECPRKLKKKQRRLLVFLQENMVYSREQISEFNLKFISIANKIYDISAFLHPGGRYILADMNSEDLTLEYYGLRSRFYENQDRIYQVFEKFAHQSSSHTLMNSLLIGEIHSQDFLHLRNPSIGTDSGEESTWSIKNAFALGSDTNIYFCQDDQKKHFIQAEHWDHFFGKYFLIEKNDQRFWMYFAVTLHPSYIFMKLTWLAAINFPFLSELQKKIPKKYKDLTEMKSVLDLDQNQKQRETVAQSGKFLLEIPLLSFRSQSKSFDPVIQGQNFTLSSALGK